MTTEDDGFEPVEIIYAGKREGTKGTFLIFYNVVNEDEDLTFQSTNVLKTFRHAVIGGVYLAHRKDLSFKFSNKYLRASGSPRVAEWLAADTAHDVTAKARKLLALEKEKSRGSVAELLVPLRREYLKTDRIGRLALEVIVLEALRRSV